MRFPSPEAFAKRTVASVQEYSLLTWHAISAVFSRPRYIDDTFTQMDYIGFGSIPIVILTGFFTGCVLTLQSATSLKQFGAVNMTGRLVALSMVKELGHGERHEAAGHVDGAELLERCGGLQREHAAGEETGEDDDGDRAEADVVHLGEGVVDV